MDLVGKKNTKENEEDVLDNINHMKAIRADGLRRLNRGLSNDYNLIGNPLVEVGINFEEKLISELGY